MTLMQSVAIIRLWCRRWSSALWLWAQIPPVLGLGRTMFEITRREAAILAMDESNVIRRAWHRCTYEAGSKIPVVLAPKTKALFMLEVIGVIRETIDEIGDSEARAEGYRSKQDWLENWGKLYGGTVFMRGTTRVWTLRIRKTHLMRRRPVATDGF